MATMPIRIDGDLFEAARTAGVTHSRSAAQQLHHWARVGREFETSPTTTVAAVERVLSGSATYDEVDERAQAVIRVAWQDELDAILDGLDLTADLNAAGLPWVEADADGNVIEHRPGPAAG